MPATRSLTLLSAALAAALAACAPTPPKPRGMFDLSNGPEPGSVPPPDLGTPVHTGAGHSGAP